MALCDALGFDVEKTFCHVMKNGKKPTTDELMDESIAVDVVTDYKLTKKPTPKEHAEIERLNELVSWLTKENMKLADRKAPTSFVNHPNNPIEKRFHAST